MHASLGNDLSVEMRELLDKPDILEKGRAACSCSLNVQVIDNRCAIGMGELVIHVSLPEAFQAGALRRTCLVAL